LASQNELRCSVQSRGAGADPIGTAGAYDAYVLVEAPLPWPKDIGEDPVVAQVMAAVGATGVSARVLGVVPEGNDPTRRRLVVHRKPDGPFRRYVRAETVVGPDELPGAAHDLLTGPVPERDPDDGVVLDLLVCTHGKRDRCCGSMGTTLHGAIANRYGALGVRTMRVSHTGGHRFAPTAIFLPDGHMWAWLDTELIDGLVRRTRNPADIARFYRGAAAIGGPAVQVAEREAFAREGWAWLDSLRAATIETDGDQHQVRLEASWDDGRTVTFEAVVVQTGTIAQPICGEPPEVTKKSDPVWALTDFVEAVGAGR